MQRDAVTPGPNLLWCPPCGRASALPPWQCLAFSGSLMELHSPDLAFSQRVDPITTLNMLFPYSNTLVPDCDRIKPSAWLKIFPVLPTQALP